MTGYWYMCNCASILELRMLNIVSLIQVPWGKLENIRLASVHNHPSLAIFKGKLPKGSQHLASNRDYVSMGQNIL